MALLEDYKEPSWFQRIACNVVKAGEIPKHIAIIMDGNRRFAVQRNMEKTKGHFHGFRKLSEVLGWLLFLGVREVSVFAFSIENFKRSKEEITTLMKLAEDNLRKILLKRELLDKHQLRVCVIGNITLLPLHIQKLIAEVVLQTQSNTKGVLNVCLAYTAREEFAMASRAVAEGVSSGQLLESDINADLMEKCLYTGNSPRPDLLIRTSGEVRLSDFMLWQCEFSSLCFTPVLWPQLSLWNLLGAIIQYQQTAKQLNALRDLAETSRKVDLTALSTEERTIEEEREKRRKQFIDSLYSKRITDLQAILQS